ncbi:MAG: AAA family ATPase [Candidatus Omnitrophica bacterium]|nr:AAA family ATPase [Candidatus Omnitrophota bacterium]
MYEMFYGLREPPFHVTADPAFLFPSRQHREALDHLTYGIQQRLGCLVVTGEVGSGKTTVIKTVLAQLPADSVRTSLLLNPTFSDVQLLEAIVQDFGIAPGRKTRAALMDALNRFLLDQQGHGRTAVLIIDEAQTLAARTLEQIRLLSNFETQKEKLLQIVLVGQPELDDQLADPRLRPLRQRVAVRCRIAPLAEGDVGAYIAHRLRVAGAAADRPRFTPEATRLIARQSRGLPRAINHVCENALLAGFVRETMTIDAPLVRDAIDMLEGLASQPTEELHESDHRRLAESPVPAAR